MEITETDDMWSGLRRFSEWLRLKKGVIARILCLQTKDSGKSHPKEDGVLRDQRARNLATRSLKVGEVDRAGEDYQEARTKPCLSKGNRDPQDDLDEKTTRTTVNSVR